MLTVKKGQALANVGLRVVAVGPRSFVAGFSLAGTASVEAKTAEEAVAKIRSLVEEGDVALIIVSEELASKASEEINRIRASKAVPMIYVVGRKMEKVNYRDVIRSIMGI